MKTASYLTQWLAVALCVGGLAACSKPAPPEALLTASLAQPMTETKTERSDSFKVIRAREDFYEHVNGEWLATTEIPADQSAWGTWTQLEEVTHGQLKSLIDGLGSRPSDRTAAKIATLYASFMDEARVETVGITPILADWSRIESLNDKQEIPALIAHFNKTNVEAPYKLLVHQDARDSTRYIVDIRQSGLGLPARDYYLNGDANLARVGQQYQAHIETMLKLAGDSGADTEALAIFKLETELAKIQWTLVENGDPIKTYNKYPIADLAGLTGHYDWHSYLKSAGIDGKVKFLIISQPSYLTAFGHLIESTSLAVWKSYFKWHVLMAAAPYLSKPFVDAQFAFFGTALRGILENRSRSCRGVTLVNELIGDALGKLYVKQYFPPKTKDNIDAMAQVVLAAFRTRIKSLDWMSPATQKAAQKKINALVLKLGYPAKYRDYGKLVFAEDDLFGNVARGVAFEYQRNIAKVGAPIDRDEWKTLPQTVGAYYDPQLNEVAFSAAVLQAPFYDVNAEAAVNYGGIGVIISREISHAFDEVGSQYAANGELRDWFAGQDRDKFEQKNQALIAQYDAYEPVPGHHLSGRGTLGENMADDAGIAIAYQAYHLALAGKETPTLNGVTGDQRLFLSFSQAWRSTVRPDEAIVRLLSDRQSPAAVRIDASLVNQDAFAAVFGLQEGDRMYRAPSRRVHLW